MEKAQRLISLDILRGITIAGMIIVNNPGSWKHQNMMKMKRLQSNVTE